MRQERRESSKRGCVTKPAIASGQNRSRHLATWNGSREAVFQKLSSLDQFIRETKDKQFTYRVSTFSYLSLVKIPCISSPAACILLLGKPEPLRAPSGLCLSMAGSSSRWLLALGCGVVSGGSQSLSGLAHKLSLVQTATNLILWHPQHPGLLFPHL